MIEVKRKGETFTEFLVATAVFGIMMGGLFEFMANQSETLSDIKNRDELMFYAQKYVNTPKDKRPSEEDGIKFVPSDDGKSLTVSKEEDENVSMTFKLKP